MFEFFSVLWLFPFPQGSSFSVFPSASLWWRLSFGGELSLAVSIHILKNKTLKCHVGVLCALGVSSVAEFGSWVLSGSWLFSGDLHMPIFWGHSVFLEETSNHMSEGWRPGNLVVWVDSYISRSSNNLPTLAPDLILAFCHARPCGDQFLGVLGSTSAPSHLLSLL